MTGVLIVTHGNLGSEMLKTAEMIMGEQENVSALSLMYDEDINELAEKIGDEIKRLNHDEGVLVFTDLFGGSPNSSVARNLRTMDFQAITGTNMAMLLECFSMRESMSLEELALHIKATGIDGIKHINELLSNK